MYYCDSVIFILEHIVTFIKNKIRLEKYHCHDA